MAKRAYSSLYQPDFYEINTAPAQAQVDDEAAKKRKADMETVVLQTIGNWMKCQRGTQVFFVDRATNQSQWQAPEVFKSVTGTASAAKPKPPAKSGGSDAKKLPQPAAAELPRIENVESMGVLSRRKGRRAPVGQ